MTAGRGSRRSFMITPRSRGETGAQSGPRRSPPRWRSAGARRPCPRSIVSPGVLVAANPWASGKTRYPSGCRWGGGPVAPHHRDAAPVRHACSTGALGAHGLPGRPRQGLVRQCRGPPQALTAHGEALVRRGTVVPTAPPRFPRGDGWRVPWISPLAVGSQGEIIPPSPHQPRMK
jgi:hypothetical protein